MDFPHILQPLLFVPDKDAATTLFVKNVSFETTEDQLREHFPGATEIRMPTKPDGSIKG